MEIINALVAIIAVVIAALTARYTRDTVLLQRQAQLDASAPNVILYFEIDESFMVYLCVKNIGAGVAHDIHIDCNPPLRTSFANDLTKTKFISEGMKYLQPNGLLKNFFDSTMQIFSNDDLPETYDVKVRFRRDKDKSEMMNEIVLDLSCYRGIYQASHSGKDDLIKPLDKISRSMEGVSKHISSIDSTLKKGVYIRGPVLTSSLGETSWHEMLLQIIREVRFLQQNITSHTNENNKLGLIDRSTFAIIADDLRFIMKHLEDTNHIEEIERLRLACLRIVDQMRYIGASHDAEIGEALQEAIQACDKLEKIVAE